MLILRSHQSVSLAVTTVQCNHKLFLCTGTQMSEEFLVTESNYCRFAVIICTSAAQNMVVG